MGEMTIRLDDALLLALRERAEATGTNVDAIASRLIAVGLASRRDDRTAIARAIQTRSGRSPISSVELLDQIRDEGL